MLFHVALGFIKEKYCLFHTRAEYDKTGVIFSSITRVAERWFTYLFIDTTNDGTD